MEQSVVDVVQKNLNDNSQLFLIFLRGMVAADPHALTNKKKEELVDLWFSVLWTQFVMKLLNGCISLQDKGKTDKQFLSIPVWMASFLNGMHFSGTGSVGTAGMTAHYLWEKQNGESP